MRTEYAKCPYCNRKYRLDIDGALLGHNKKGKKDGITASEAIDNLCQGSHKLFLNLPPTQI